MLSELKVWRLSCTFTMGNCIGRRTTSTSRKKRSSSKCDDQFSLPPCNDNSDDNEDSDSDEPEGLFDEDVTPIYIGGYGGYSQFHYAAWNGNTAAVKDFLLKEDFDCDQQTYDQNTPFGLAAHGGRLEVFEILLKRGVNIHNADHELDTPMHYAAMNKSVKMVKLLIDHGADVNVKNKFGATPLWLAAYHGDVNLLKLLLYHNADASMYACATGARLVTRYGDGYSLPRSPLYVAVDKCAEDCVRTLISAGCDLNKEKWLQEGDYPKPYLYDDDKEMKKESIQRSIALLTKVASSPQPLLTICRSFLRQRLGKSVTVAVKDLEIPRSLADFLTLSEFCKEV